MTSRQEFGDWQTPLDFAKKVCGYLKEYLQIAPDCVIEPTCGKGAFLEAARVFAAKKIVGIEINGGYCDFCRKNIGDARLEVVNANIFGFKTKSLAENAKNPLFVGNPPWATNSALSAKQSANLPRKKNMKNLSGFDAMTGASNFDICEFIILQLLEEWRNTQATFAFVCKNSVARNVFSEIKRRQIPFRLCEILDFDAKKVFGISASACVFVASFSQKGGATDCDVKSLDAPNFVKSTIKLEKNRLWNFAIGSKYDFDGQCQFEWRQGVKHDCAKIMELKKDERGFVNGNGDVADIEGDLAFPLVKSSDFKTPVISQFSRYVILPQRKIGEDTAHLAHDFPKTWRYLNENAEFFQMRKSAIFKNSAPFSIFGVGDYTFAKHKVGVSGFYKKPLFSLLESDGLPAVADDTAYFLGFSSYKDAYSAMLILNSEIVRDFLLSISFADAKRPWTKKVLSRIDFSKICEKVAFGELWQTEKSLGLSAFFSEDIFAGFKKSLSKGLF